MLLFTLQMDTVDGMARADGEEFDPNLDTDYSSGLDNVHTHWDNPMRFLPVELHVAQGDTLQMVARHNAHDLEQVRLYGVNERMLAPPGGIGHTQLIDSEQGEKLGVVLSRKVASAL